MQVTLNNKNIELTESISLDKFLSIHGYAESKIAVAVNFCLIQRSDYLSYVVQPNDAIDIIVPMQGG
jgi:thiamine biosynthesis protein ThiS